MVWYWEVLGPELIGWLVSN